MAHHLRLVGGAVLIEDEAHAVPTHYPHGTPEPATVRVAEVYDLFGAPGEYGPDGYGPDDYGVDDLGVDPPFAA